MRGEKNGYIDISDNIGKIDMDQVKNAIFAKQVKAPEWKVPTNWGISICPRGEKPC